MNNFDIERNSKIQSITINESIKYSFLKWCIDFFFNILMKYFEIMAAHNNLIVGVLYGLAVIDLLTIRVFKICSFSFR